ncbi:aspartate aminotransferase family protein [Pelosinus baikalensis]|uniref:Acetylornithine aminotransferase n=1 Tax=Pelosinus baikalensis TaxID=2892015 RepID=A0ABS8HT58_9FIRM|nr:acetylornithine/succinylornithine family transaminase [Pelosinus baikalensis]MCC5465398.1 acetylornithine/succinylornithine family transaminase [Pelosinus baikalensis]
MDNDLITSTKEFLNEGEQSILFTTARPDVIMERGDGMFLWDTNGKQYLDFIGGWAVTCLGHCPLVITKALEQQSRELVNASPSFYNKPMIQFAKLLTESSCFDRVFFGSSGAEANEGAIKLARKYGSLYRNGAYEIITTINSFHGRTLATMSATGKKKWESLFEPKVSGFKHVPLNDIAALSKAINPNTCAIMLEPIQGEGGVFEVEENYIKAVRKICEEQSILLIFDEVQTGIGRTGTLFAYEHYGIKPDIMTLAKGIGGGFPLSALLTKEKFNIFEAGDQGGTYSGQPLAMAVGMAVVKEVIAKDLATNAQVQGNYILKKLNKLKTEFNLKDIRGKGLLIAFDLPTAKGSEIAFECFKEGLIINSPQPSTIRLMPPLIVSATEIDDMLQIISTVLKRVL